MIIPLIIKIIFILFVVYKLLFTFATKEEHSHDDREML